MGRAMGLAVMCVAALLSAGCFHTLGGTDRGPTINTLNKMHEGITTPADVEKMFGPPTRVLRPGPHRQVFVYDYSDSAGGPDVTRFTYEFKDGLLNGRNIERLPGPGAAGAVVAPGRNAL